MRVSVAALLLAAGAGSAAGEQLRASVGEALLRRRNGNVDNRCTGGQQHYADCKPCSDPCNIESGSTMCARICLPGCACPEGTWTGSDGTCYTNMACTNAFRRG
jgi:hypothetical protein